MRNFRRNPAVQGPKVDEIYGLCEEAVWQAERGSERRAKQALTRARDAIVLYIIVQWRLQPDKAPKAHAVLFGVLGKARQGMNRGLTIFNRQSPGDQAKLGLACMDILYKCEGDLFLFRRGIKEYLLSAADTLAHLRLWGF